MPPDDDSHYTLTTDSDADVPYLYQPPPAPPGEPAYTKYARETVSWSWADDGRATVTTTAGDRTVTLTGVTFPLSHPEG